MNEKGVCAKFDARECGSERPCTYHNHEQEGCGDYAETITVQGCPKEELIKEAAKAWLDDPQSLKLSKELAMFIPKRYLKKLRVIPAIQLLRWVGKYIEASQAQP